MRPAFRTALLAAAALGTLCAAPAAFAQSYAQSHGYDRYAPPPPPPPEGGYFPRDDRYVPGPLTANSDGTLGYGPYVSQPDTTPDDPGRIAYDTEKNRRVDEARGYRDDYAYAQPRYVREDAPVGYGAPYGTPGYRDRYENGDARIYDDGRRGPSPRYSDGYDEDAPRYDRPRYDGAYSTTPSYAPAPGYRGW